MNKFKFKKGFTLIELIVVVMLFMIIFLITMAFINLASGQVKSMHTKMLTNDVRSATDVIFQKLNNANATAQAVTLPSVSPKGFTVNNNILVTVSKGANGTIECNFFGLKENAIWMHRGCPIAAFNSRFLDERLTSDKIKVTSFTPTFTADPVPNIKIKIIAEDADPKYAGEENKITFESAYTMDYVVWKQMNP